MLYRQCEVQEWQKKVPVCACTNKACFFFLESSDVVSVGPKTLSASFLQPLLPILLLLNVFLLVLVQCIINLTPLPNGSLAEADTKIYFLDKLSDLESTDDDADHAIEEVIHASQQHSYQAQPFLSCNGTSLVIFLLQLNCHVFH